MDKCACRFVNRDCTCVLLCDRLETGTEEEIHSSHTGNPVFGTFHPTPNVLGIEHLSLTVVVVES